MEPKFGEGVTRNFAQRMQEVLAQSCINLSSPDFLDFSIDKTVYNGMEPVLVEVVEETTRNFAQKMQEVRAQFVQSYSSLSSRDAERQRRFDAMEQKLKEMIEDLVQEAAARSMVPESVLLRHAQICISLGKTLLSQMQQDFWRRIWEQRRRMILRFHQRTKAAEYFVHNTILNYCLSFPLPPPIQQRSNSPLSQSKRPKRRLRRKSSKRLLNVRRLLFVKKSQKTPRHTKYPSSKDASNQPSSSPSSQK